MPCKTPSGFTVLNEIQRWESRGIHENGKPKYSLEGSRLPDYAQFTNR